MPVRAVTVGCVRVYKPYHFPRIKFTDINSSGRQLQHVYSELVEIIQARNKGQKGCVDEEMADMLHSIETYFRIREKEGIDIRATFEAVIDKNIQRGYYGGITPKEAEGVQSWKLTAEEKD